MAMRKQMNGTKTKCRFWQTMTWTNHGQTSSLVPPIHIPIYQSTIQSIGKLDHDGTTTVHWGRWQMALTYGAFAECDMTS